MREGINIYDLPAMSTEYALKSIADTMKSHFWMPEAYDTLFIKDLVRRKGAYNNFLLLLLVQPDDYRIRSIWNQIDIDLQTLKADNALISFKRKMRLIEKAAFESWYTELSLAAWLSRQGLSIYLEPDVGSNAADFRVGTNPETWWEIKSLQSSKDIMAENTVLQDLQRRLSKIPERYSLSVTSCNLQLSSVPLAVKNIRKQLSAHYTNSGPTPATFEYSGLVVEATSTTRRYGYLGSILGNEYWFADEKADQVAKALQGARIQLPPDKAGIIVIDSTQAQFISDDDVVEACYGKTKLSFINYEAVTLRSPGQFRPNFNTRISAVIWYSRSFVEIGTNFDMLVIHNPFAKEQLPDNFLPEEGIRQMRLHFEGSRKIRIDDFTS